MWRKHFSWSLFFFYQYGLVIVSRFLQTKYWFFKEQCQCSYEQGWKHWKVKSLTWDEGIRVQLLKLKMQTWFLLTWKSCENIIEMRLLLLLSVCCMTGHLFGFVFFLSLLFLFIYRKRNKNLFSKLSEINFGNFAENHLGITKKMLSNLLLLFLHKKKMMNAKTVFEVFMVILS